MNAVLVDWIPAETENARVPRTATTTVPDARAATAINAAIERVKCFETQLLQEAEDRPLMVIDRP